MKDTIKAKVGYRVYGVKGDETRKKRLLYDGEQRIMHATLLSWEEHLNKIKDDEGYSVLEIFTTVKGTQFLYTNSPDSDIFGGDDYLVKLSK